MIVEPSEQDLIRRKPEKLVERLAILKQPVKLWMILQIDLGKQPPPDDLPDKTQNEMFPSINEILRTDVDDGATDTFGGSDDDVVVFCHLKSIGSFSAFAYVEHTLVDGVWYGIVDELAEDEAITAFVKELEGIGWDRQTRTNDTVPG